MTDVADRTADALDERLAAADARNIDATRSAELRRMANLTWTLAITDWKLRFYGSALGVLWTLVRPFAFFGVIYTVFTQVAHLNKNVPNFGIYILFALVLFTFFAETTSNSVQALVARENLLRKMQFNPIVIPLAVTVTALLNLVTTFAAVFIFAFANGVWPDWAWLELIPIVALLALLATGVGMMLAALYVRFRDMQPIWEVVSQALFYASSVLYVATTVPEKWQRPFLCNPLAALFAQMRHAVVDPNAHSTARLMGGSVRVLIPLGVILGVFALGLWIFQREGPKVAENL